MPVIAQSNGHRDRFRERLPGKSRRVVLRACNCAGTRTAQKRNSGDSTIIMGSGPGTTIIDADFTDRICDVDILICGFQ